MEKVCSEDMVGGGGGSWLWEKFLVGVGVAVWMVVDKEFREVVVRVVDGAIREMGILYLSREDDLGSWA